MLSIITVNFNSYDWLNILLESIELFTKCEYEIIVVDNSHKPLKIENLKQVINHGNLGHGEGLNQGVKEASFDYIIFLDVDCHAVSHGWEQPFFELAKNYQVIGGKGSLVKPIRPACMFLTKKIAQKYDWRATEGYQGHRLTPGGFDVAIKAYYQMLQDNVPIKLLEPQKSLYNTINGEEWAIDNKRLIYHHWSGTWLENRQKDFKENLFDDKQKLFNSLPWKVL